MNMDTDYWRERWARSETGFHQKEINPHLQRFWSALNLAPGSRVFVPLCGKSRDMLWLRGQGHEVVGVEISPLAVEAFFAEAACMRQSQNTIPSASTRQKDSGFTAAISSR